jgi:hypothetical protein
MISSVALNHLQHLSQQVNLLYQSCRDERIQLAQWENDRSFSVLGELEILAGTLQGYVGQVLQDRLAQPSDAIEKLQHSNPFDIPELAAWYFSDGRTYPHLSHYLEILDYLRLSLLTTAQQTNLQVA